LLRLFTQEQDQTFSQQRAALDDEWRLHILPAMSFPLYVEDISLPGRWLGKQLEGPTPPTKMSRPGPSGDFRRDRLFNLLIKAAFSWYFAWPGRPVWAKPHQLQNGSKLGKLILSDTSSMRKMQIMRISSTEPDRKKRAAPRCKKRLLLLILTGVKPISGQMNVRQSISWFRMTACWNDMAPEQVCRRI